MGKDKAPAVRAKTLAYPEVVRQGLIKEGDVLRYVNKQGELLGVGVARERGIQIQPDQKPVGPTAFEAACGSKAHRPNEFTLIPDSLTLQETIARHLLGDAAPPPNSGKKAVQAAKQASAQQQQPVPLTDGTDDHCKLCGYGGDLLCCEVCPSVFHPACVGLPGVPDGEWYCPACCCARCGGGGFGDPLELRPRGVAVEAPLGSQPWPSASPSHALPQPLPLKEQQPQQQPQPQSDLAQQQQQKMQQQSDATQPPPPQQQQQEGQWQPQPAQRRPLLHVPNFEEGAYQRQREVLRAQQVASEPPELPLPPPAPPTNPEVLASLSAAASLGGHAVPPADTREVCCPGSGTRVHAGCLPPERLPGGAAPSPTSAPAAADAAAGGGGGVGASGDAELWFSSDDARRASHYMAGVCAAGPQPLAGLEAGGAPLAWQLIRGAAVRSPQSCRGYFPTYSPAQREWLRSVLSAALAVMSSGLPPVKDAHTGRDLLPLLLMGCSGSAAAGGGGAGAGGGGGSLPPGSGAGGPSVCFDGMHTAVLWAGGTVAAAAVVRVSGGGGAVAELPVLVVRAELRGNGLGGALLRCVERCCARAGAEVMLTPAPVPPAASSDPGQAVPPPGDVRPETFSTLNHSWAYSRGYRTADAPLRLAAARAGVLFPMRAPLAAKLLPLQPPASVDDIGSIGAELGGDVAAALPWVGPLVMADPGASLLRLARDGTGSHQPPAAAASAKAAAVAAADGAAPKPEEEEEQQQAMTNETGDGSDGSGATAPMDVDDGGGASTAATDVDPRLLPLPPFPAAVKLEPATAAGTGVQQQQQGDTTAAASGPAVKPDPGQAQGGGPTMPLHLNGVCKPPPRAGGVDPPAGCTAAD